MNSKIKKIMLLTTGLAGGLIATSVAGITLSSCTFQVQQDPNNSNNQGSSGNNNSSNQTTSPKDELTYNPNANYYTTQIVFDQSGNITNASANMLTISNDLIFADPAMTILIGIMPNVEKAQITIPSTVRAITGYSAAVVYNNADGSIVNPDFKAGTGLVIDSSTQTLVDLGSVGAFQKVGTIAPGAAATPPTMSPATGLSTLTSINFASGSQLQTIGPKAFAGCSNLTTITNLPNTCNTIGAAAFQNCTNLQSINLKGVQYIGDAAFNNAFIASNDAIATSNQVSLDLSSAQYLGVGAFDSSKWTSNTRAAGDQVASGTSNATETPHLSKISSVTFGSQLNTLSTYAFNGANYLTSADLSNCTNLAKVADNAFRNTQNLTSVKFSNTIDTIGTSAFSGAKSLASANFPSGLQTIGQSAFTGCPLAGSFSPESTTLDIGDSAFDGSQFEKIDFSKVVGNLTIGQSAFANNSTLTSMTFADNANLKPGSQLQIKSQAFSGCTKLTLGTAGADGQASSLTLPNNLTLLANNAFPSSITFNSTYTNPLQISSDALISNSAFGGKWDLNQNGVSPSNENNMTNTLTLGPQLFANNQNITNIDLSGSNIQALGWKNTSNLQSVLGSSNFTIPNGSNNPTSTQLGTFANAQKLTTITLPATCSQFGAGVNNYYWSSPFANCKSLTDINYNGFDLTPVSEGENPVTAGFNQINQTTWTQVANIMNAFGYAGQQTIGTNGTVTDNPSAAEGTWVGTNGLGSKSQSGNSIKCWQSGMNGWHASGSSVDSWVNQPINVYGAGSYSYYTTGAAQGSVGRVINEATPKTVKYPAGLGYSTAATATAGQTTTGTLAAPVLDGSVTADYLTVNSSNLNDNTTIQVPTSTGALATETITISGNRPLSVWYTVGTSQPANPADNIYIPAAGKLVGITTGNNGTSNSGNGGIGWTSTALNHKVTKKGDGSTDIGNDGAGTPFKLEGSTSDVGNPAQNFYTLPLGITESTDTAYFNHNGVIWQYKKDDATGAITITGTVNYYIGGRIKSQASGISNNPGLFLQNQTSNHGATGLTFIDVIGEGNNDSFHGLNGENYTYNSGNFGLFLFSQNGVNATGQPAPISAEVGPKGLTVTLTLVPPTTNGQQ